MRLLLDEMISWRIAAELRARGHDVVAVRRDRLELEGTPDPVLLELAATERRAVVTNDVRDYRVAHDRTLARGDTHYGVVYTYDDTLPRSRASLPLWVAMLDTFLATHPAEDALLNQTLVLELVAQ